MNQIHRLKRHLLAFSLPVCLHAGSWQITMDQKHKQIVLLVMERMHFVALRLLLFVTCKMQEKNHALPTTDEDKKKSDQRTLFFVSITVLSAGALHSIGTMKVLFYF